MPTKESSSAAKRNSKAKAKESTTKRSTVKKESAKTKQVIEVTKEPEPYINPESEQPIESKEKPAEAKEQPAETKEQLDTEVVKAERLILKFQSKSALKSLVADFLLGDETKSQSL